MYDGGADRGPVDGTNDSINVPSASGCPLPGVGVCAALPTITCELAPGSGADPLNAECPPHAGCLGCPLCVETLTGPDGLNGADAATQSVGFGKAIVKVEDRTPPGLWADSVELKCWAEDVKAADQSLVTTVYNGTCAGGPQNGQSCQSNADCDASPRSRYFCLSGDELYCQFDVLSSSNRDNDPPCGGPCLVAVAPGARNQSCGLLAGAQCMVGTCAGGARAGQACDILETLSCPGGFCNGLGNPMVLTGDEVGLYFPAFTGMAYQLCPFKTREDLPLELTSGAGVVTHDLADEPQTICLPKGTDVQVLGAYLHQPAPASTAGLFEFYTGATVASSQNKIPCPNVSLPIPESLTGLPTRSATGPVIGASIVELR